MSHNWGPFAWFIQQSLYEGKQPDKDGYYVFTRKELADGAGKSVGTFDNNRFGLEYYFSTCSLKEYGKYPEYANEMLYIDVKYEKGKFRFKRNTITMTSELEHLWALPPLCDYFVYDCFDEQHRRRTNYSKPLLDSFPWSWSEEQIQEELKHPA